MLASTSNTGMSSPQPARTNKTRQSRSREMNAQRTSYESIKYSRNALETGKNIEESSKPRSKYMPTAYQRMPTKE